jgi:hypothetical protein
MGIGTLTLIISRLDSTWLALQLPVTARHAAQPGTAFNWLCYHDTIRSVGSIWLCNVGGVLVCLCHTPSPPRSLLGL